MKILPSTRFSGTDEYIAAFPKSTAALLQQVRQTIKAAAPEAEETISYNMPCFAFNGPLVWYAGYERHIGLYPTPAAIVAFAEELSKYKTSKGAIQFPTDQPMPLVLIKKIVRFRLEENKNKAAAKKQRTTK